MTLIDTVIKPIKKVLPSTKGSASAMQWNEVENIWMQAGGNPQAAAMAAAVADSESGLNPNAARTNPDGTKAVGLWQLPANGQPPGSKDPLANARVAVQLSKNGTDWTQWCTTWSDNNCGCNDGQYLGEGANALGALGTQLQPSSYNMFGAQPRGDGVGASAATENAHPAPTKTSALPKVLFIVVLLAVGAYAFMRFER